MSEGTAVAIRILLDDVNQLTKDLRALQDIISKLEIRIYKIEVKVSSNI